MKAILTGGLGFIGFNFYNLFRDKFQFLVIDRRSYASNPKAEEQMDKLVIADIADPATAQIVREFEPQFVFNFAAETHVDRSILDSKPFVASNVLGTVNLLEACRAYCADYPDRSLRFVQISTDEVYGSLGMDDVPVTEETPLNPRSPYSASKAAADHFVHAYHFTYGLDTVVTRCSNNYGPWQFPEKLIPLMICQALEDQPLPVYGMGSNVRDWIHVDDHCRGIVAAACMGRSGEVYNFGGLAERTNIELVKFLLARLGKPESLIRFVTDRKGHDFRYAIDCHKAMTQLDWKPQVSFEIGLTKTIEWNLAHLEWLRFIRRGEYKTYYDQNYGVRLT